MKLKLRHKLSSALKTSAASVLVASLLTPLIGVFAPVVVNATVCNTNAGGGGTLPNLMLTATSGQVDSTVKKVGVEVTPQNTFRSDDSFRMYGISFADSSCVYNKAGFSFDFDAPAS